MLLYSAMEGRWFCYLPPQPHGLFSEQTSHWATEDYNYEELLTLKEKEVITGSLFWLKRIKPPSLLLSLSLPLHLNLSPPSLKVRGAWWIMDGVCCLKTHAQHTHLRGMTYYIKDDGLLASSCLIDKDTQRAWQHHYQGKQEGFDGWGHWGTSQQYPKGLLLNRCQLFFSAFRSMEFTSSGNPFLCLMVSGAATYGPAFCIWVPLPWTRFDVNKDIVGYFKYAPYFSFIRQVKDQMEDAILNTVYIIVNMFFRAALWLNPLVH